MDLFSVQWKPEAQGLAWNTEAIPLQPRGLTLRLETWPLVVPLGLAWAFLPSPEVQIQQEGVGSVSSQNSAWSEGLLRSRSPLRLARACEAATIAVDPRSGAPSSPSATRSLRHQVFERQRCSVLLHNDALASDHPALVTARQRPSADMSGTCGGNTAPAVWQPCALLQLPTTLRFCHRLLKTWHSYRNKWALKGNPDLLCLPLISWLSSWRSGPSFWHLMNKMPTLQEMG